jgi:hypothetical protein
MFLLTISHGFVKFCFRRRILGIVRKISGTDHLSAPSSKYLTKTATRSLPENPDSIQMFMHTTTMHAVGLSIQENAGYILEYSDP